MGQGGNIGRVSCVIGRWGSRVNVDILYFPIFSQR